MLYETKNSKSSNKSNEYISCGCFYVNNFTAFMNIKNYNYDYNKECAFVWYSNRDLLVREIWIIEEYMCINCGRITTRLYG